MSAVRWGISDDSSSAQIHRTSRLWYIVDLSRTSYGAMRGFTRRPTCAVLRISHVAMHDFKKCKHKYIVLRTRQGAMHGLKYANTCTHCIENKPGNNEWLQITSDKFTSQVVLDAYQLQVIKCNRSYKYIEGISSIIYILFTTNWCGETMRPLLSSAKPINNPCLDSASPSLTCRGVHCV